MRNISVKVKITVWLTLLMALLAGLLMAFMLSISSTVASQTAMSQLSQVVRSSVGQVGMSQGKLELKDGFHFYRNGVSILVYSQDEALLAGQLPVSFTAEEPFQSGVTRMVSAGDDQYLVLDLWLPMSCAPQSPSSRGPANTRKNMTRPPDERQETISMIHRQAVRMSNLISQLLRMTRLEQGAESARRTEVKLGGLLRSLCDEQVYDQSRLTLEFQEDVTVLADPALLSRLVQNLVDNAFKYGKPEGHVWVSAGRQAGEVLLQVRDDGIGIPPDQQEKVWQRFYQADPSHSGMSGAGLGLSLVQQSAQAHGGYMTLESIPGAGSTFTLHLPDEKKTASKA